MSAFAIDRSRHCTAQWLKSRICGTLRSIWMLVLQHHSFSKDQRPRRRRSKLTLRLLSGPFQQCCPFWKTMALYLFSNPFQAPRLVLIPPSFWAADLNGHTSYTYFSTFTSKHLPDNESHIDTQTIKILCKNPADKPNGTCVDIFLVLCDLHARQGWVLLIWASWA